MEVDKMCLAVEIEGKAYYVVLSDAAKDIVLMAAQGMSDNGKLSVVPAPEGSTFMPMCEINRKKPIGEG